MNVQMFEREGGHILVLLLLVLLGAAIFIFTADHTERVLDATLGALLLAMKGNGNGKLPPPPNISPEPTPPKTESPTS